MKGCSLDSTMDPFDLITMDWELTFFDFQTFFFSLLVAVSHLSWEHFFFQQKLVIEKIPQWECLFLIAAWIYLVECDTTYLQNKSFRSASLLKRKHFLIFPAQDLHGPICLCSSTPGSQEWTHPLPTWGWLTFSFLEHLLEFVSTYATYTNKPESSFRAHHSWSYYTLLIAKIRVGNKNHGPLCWFNRSAVKYLIGFWVLAPQEKQCTVSGANTHDSDHGWEGQCCLSCYFWR